MPALTPRQLRWMHSVVGQDINDASLQERYDSLESVRDVVIEVVREQKNLLLDSPLDVSVNGVASVRNTENVKALERELARLVGLDDDPSDDTGQPPSETGVINKFEQIPLSRSRGR